MRFWIGVLGALSCSLFYTHRSSLSVAVVQMARYNSSNVVHDDSVGQCFDSGVSENSTADVVIRGEFEWSESTQVSLYFGPITPSFASPVQGLILGASYYMYLITPTISGRITERFGAKWVTLASVTVPAIIHAILPTAAYSSVYLMIALLIIQGLFHGCVFPSLFSLYANWFPPTERAYAIGALAAGSNFGNLVSFPLSGYLCEHGFAGGWPSVFYVICILHIPWVVCWYLVVEDTPMKSNAKAWLGCSDQELKHIQVKSNSFGAPKRSSTAPWIKIFSSTVVWSSIISKITCGWGYYLLLSKLPSYLDKVFGISLFHNGLFNAGTSLATGFTMVMGGPLSGLIIRKTAGKVSKTAIRKAFQMVAMLGPAVCLAVITGLHCDSTAVVSLLILALFLYGLTTGGEFGIISEFAPDFSGTIFGIAATLSSWPAFVAPPVVGVILDDSPGETRRWNTVFYITIGIYVFGAIVFLLGGSAEPQEWGLLKKEEKKHGDKNEDEKAEWS